MRRVPVRRVLVGAVLVGVVLGLVVVAGCSGGDGGGRSAPSATAGRDAAGGDDASVVADARALAPTGSAAAAEPAGRQGFADLPAGVSPLDGRDVIRTATIGVKVRRVGDAVDDAVALVTAAGGILASEKAAFGDRTDALVVFEVPPARFEAVLDDLAGLGKRYDQQVSTDDVTGQVVDLESRLASATASANRLRALFERATNVGEVVAIEAELVRREAEVEALEGQLRVLRAQVDLATITLTLSRAPAAPVEPEAEATGFVAGLERGWEALVAVADAGATAAGAVLPFAVVAGAGALVVVAVRRRQRARRPPQAGAGATT
jgi:hypothetical protein